MTDEYKNGLITGLAMQPLHVGTVIKRVPAAYFGVAGAVKDVVIGKNSLIGIGGSADGLVLDDSVVAWTKNGDFISNMEYVYWPKNANTETGVWYNSGSSSGGNMIITGAEKYNNYIKFSSSGSGIVELSFEPKTIYCWCKINAGNNTWKPLVTKDSPESKAYYGFDIFANPSNLFGGDCVGIGNYYSSAYSRAILCLTKSSEWEFGETDKDKDIHYGFSKFYIDGMKISGSLDSNRCYYGNYNNQYRINDCYRGSDWNQSVSANYYMIAFSSREHSEDEIRTNIQNFYSQIEI